MPMPGTLGWGPQDPNMDGRLQTFITATARTFR